MKRQPIVIAAVTGVVVFTLTAYWWFATDGNRDHQSIWSLLAPSAHATSGTSSAAPGELFAIRDKVAVIVETRPLRTLIPLILHFATVLGREWPILFFTRASTVQTLEAFGQGSQPFKRMVKDGQVKIIELPSQPTLQNYLGISNFLASEWFWSRMGPAHHMLLFQTDSILCANSGRRVEDFFEYDFIGAAHPYHIGAFNGGLSLRNVTLSRQVVSMSDIADDVSNGTGFGIYEDVWFWDKMKGLGGQFPTPEKASEFAVDFIWGERPLGYHGVNKSAHDNRIDEIYAWCPEAALAAASGEVLELNEDEKNSSAIIEDVETEGGELLPFG